jgi:hypothetical protein
MSRNILNKKGQVHISETVLVLFVVIVILMLGVVVYFRFAVERNKNTPFELSERRATIMLVKTVSLDELACTNEHCVDTAKFLPFQRVLGVEFDRFKRIFGRKKIVFRVIYPEPEEKVKDVECDVSKYIQVEYPQNCGKWTIYEYHPENNVSSKISTPVSLYYPEFDKYVVGRLEIEHYGEIKK